MDEMMGDLGKGTPRRRALWCLGLMEMLTEGGVWGVPRSGIVFKKVGRELHLIDAMPWVPEMPVTAQELQRIQHTDMLSITHEFKQAGIRVGYGEGFKWPSDGWSEEES